MESPEYGAAFLVDLRSCVLRPRPPISSLSLFLIVWLNFLEMGLTVGASVGSYDCDCSSCITAITAPSTPGSAQLARYAFNISRRDSTRSISGRMPNSVEMARDSSSRDTALARSPALSPSRRVSE